jgi:hypothetical protein
MTDKNVKTAADDQPGACYIPDPQTGQPKCHYITKSECDQRSGVFYGGLCPPVDAMASVKVKPGMAKAEKTKTTKKNRNIKKIKITKKPKSIKKKTAAKRKKKAE